MNHHLYTELNFKSNIIIFVQQINLFKKIARNKFPIKLFLISCFKEKLCNSKHIYFYYELGHSNHNNLFLCPFIHYEFFKLLVPYADWQLKTNNVIRINNILKDVSLTNVFYIFDVLTRLNNILPIPKQNL